MTTPPWAFMNDPATGRFALFAENGTSGDRSDPNSAINGPLNNPASYFNKLRFHSDCDYFEVAFSGSGTITHAAISAISVPDGQSAAFMWNAGGDDQLLMTHNLGYAPFALVAVGNNILWPGMPIQSVSGGSRNASAYTDTTSLRIATTASIGANSMGSQVTTYQYLVFKDPPPASGHILLDFDPDTGITQMGLGKFSSDRKYLQIASGGSPFSFAMGRTIDLNNGAPRTCRQDGTTVDVVPSGLSTYLHRQGYSTTGDISTPIQGSSMAYGGSFTGPGSILVQAP